MATIYYTLSTKKAGNKKQVMVRFSHNKINHRAKSGIYVPQEYWDDTTQSVLIPRKRLMTDDMIALIAELREIDAKLRELTQAIDDAFYANPQLPLDNPDWLKDIIDRVVYGKNPDEEILTFFDVWDKFSIHKKVSRRRKQLYDVVRKMLARFEAVKRKTTPRFQLTLDGFTSATIEDFESFIYDESEYVKKYPDIYNDPEFYRSGRAVQRGRNTVSGRLEILHTFFVWARDFDHTTNDPFKRFSIKPPLYGTPIYITKEERDKLFATDMGRESLNRVRDIFVFQCCIGCRIGDMTEFKKSNVVNGAIEYIAEKTSKTNLQTIRVPLNSIALTIIDRYKDLEGDKLLPFISHQRFNEHLKKCFKIAGLDRIVTKPNPLTGKPMQVPLYDIAHSHMARKTFVSIIYQYIQDPALISALTGHAEDSESFSHYRDIDAALRLKTVKLLE